MFEIGKVYKCRSGTTEYKIVAKAEDGRLICETTTGGQVAYRPLSYRNADGTSILGPGFRAWDLIDPDEPTPEELEWLAKLYDARGMSGIARSIAERWSTNSYFLRQLKVIREMLNHART